ncbi:MAG: rhomboid family intramembrane serine protease [Deltaproteobacteria bacterium]|nr:rhomboid family intramembrane serine protease [Deltaproteobacteria bacterium]
MSDPPILETPDLLTARWVQVAGAFAQQYSDLQVHRISENACHFARMAFPRLREYLLVKSQKNDFSAFRERLMPVLKSRKRAALEVVVFTNDPQEAFDALADLFGGALQKQAALTVIRPDGAPLHKGRTSLRAVFERALDPDAAAENKSAFHNLATQTVDEQAERQEQGAQAHSLFAGMSTRTPYATYGLAAVLVTIFTVGWVFGGSIDATSDLALLVRMGAQVPSSHPLSEQWWRLLTAPLLHGGPLHLLSNIFVLYVLGRPLEQLLGASRFLVLITTSMLSGSLLSFTLGDAASVGASGGVWGVLVAFFVLGMRPSSLLPDEVRKGWRRMGILNLALNLCVSFLPFVDKWAHFGGGAVSLLWFGSGFLIWRLKRPRVPSTTKSTDAPQAAAKFAKEQVLFSTLAVILTVTFAAGAISSIVQGRPWQLRTLQLHDVDIGGGCVLSIASEDFTKKSESWIAGDPQFDSFTIETRRLPAFVFPESAVARQFILDDIATSPSYIRDEMPAYFSKDGNLQQVFRYENAPHLLGRKTSISLGATVEAVSFTSLCNEHFSGCDGRVHQKVARKLAKTCQ